MRTAIVTVASLLVVAAVSEAYGIDYYAYPKYHFNYKVHDPHTGDVKEQWESRDGDKVHGQYQLNEPDGTIRVVKYNADDHNGFNAQVEKHGHAIHPQQVKRQGWDNYL